MWGTPRSKGYALNMKKALEKRINACNRMDISIESKDTSNFVMRFSTVAFEEARKGIKSMFHGELNSDTTSRHMTYIPELDKAGLIVSEVIKINSWSAVEKPHTSSLNGKCSIVVHLYRTTSSCLINGADTGILVEWMIPVLNTLLNSNDKNRKKTK